LDCLCPGSVSSLVFGAFVPVLLSSLVLVGSLVVWHREREISKVWGTDFGRERNGSAMCEMLEATGLVTSEMSSIDVSGFDLFMSESQFMAASAKHIRHLGYFSNKFVKR
jgi:hypothetical protein